MGPINLLTNTIGYGLRQVGKAAWSGTKAVGDAVLTGADKVTIGAAKAGKTGVKLGTKGAYKASKGILSGGAWLARDAVAGMNSKNPGINILGNAITKGIKASDKLMKGTYESYEINPITRELVHRSGGLKFTKLGAGVILGSGALIGARDAASTHMDNRVGPIDPHKVTATPEIAAEEYSINNGGATGDLVFALHQNRRG